MKKDTVKINVAHDWLLYWNCFSGEVLEWPFGILCCIWSYNNIVNGFTENKLTLLIFNNVMLYSVTGQLIIHDWKLLHYDPQILINGCADTMLDYCSYTLNLLQVQACCDKYKHIFLFSVHNMRNTHLKEVRQSWTGSR